MRTSTVSVANVQAVDGTTQTDSVSRSSTQTPHVPVVFICMFAVIVMAVLMWFTLSTWIRPNVIHIATGYIPLAGIVAISAALERFLEPLSALNPPWSQPPKRARQEAKTAKDIASTAMTAAKDAATVAHHDPGVVRALERTAAEAARKANLAPGTTASDAMAMAKAAASDPQLTSADVGYLVQAAADKQAKLRADRTVFFWAIATIFGLGISGGFGFLLLQTVSSNHVNRLLDLLVTGLTIGAGTKPMHDLITGIQSK